MIHQYLSVMADTYIDDDGITKLSLGMISGSEALPDFRTLYESVTIELRGTVGQGKFSHYGWIPSLFIRHPHPKKSWKPLDTYRDADGEIDRISCLVCDVDNEKPGEKVLWKDVTPFGWTCFGYDSFSGTATNPRFRLVIETDREMNRVEVRQVSAWVNKHVLNFQNDMSMADRAHYAIAPDYRAETYWQDGVPLCVDAILQLVAEEIAAGCQYLAVASVSRAIINPPQLSPAASVLMQTSTQISHDPGSWLCAADLAEYANPISGHWQTMFKLLQRAWKRSGGTLSAFDMHTLAQIIDGAGGGYFARKYTAIDLDNRIKDAMVVSVNRRFFGDKPQAHQR